MIDTSRMPNSGKSSMEMYMDYLENFIKGFAHIKNIPYTIDRFYSKGVIKWRLIL